uniref:AAA_12 domain-containing protein n=1 Tax=Globodera pallida TaxID=36090 RepID=A0A183BUQ0_GLOPA
MRNKKPKNSKKAEAAVIPPPAGQRQLAPQTTELVYEDLSPDEAEVEKEVPASQGMPANEETEAEELLAPADAIESSCSPTAAERIFSDDPEMAKEVGSAEQSENIPPQLKEMLESSAFGLTVTVGAGEQQNDEKTPEGGRESVEVEQVGALGTMGLLIGALCLQEGEAQPLESANSITTESKKEMEEVGKVKNKDLGPSVMCKKNGTEVGAVEVEAEEAESVFGNEGFDEKMDEAIKEVSVSSTRKRPLADRMDEDEEESEGNAMGKERRMLICQVEEKAAMAVRLGVSDEKPRFVLISKEGLNLKVELKLGDIVMVSEWKSTKKFKDWISQAFRINAEAEATKVSQIYQVQPEVRVGVIMEVQEKAKKKNPTAFDVAVPGNELLQRLYPHQADPRLNLRSLTPGSLVRVTHVQIDRPAQIAIGPKGLYVLPAKFEEVTNEPVAHQPTVTTGIRDLVSGYKFPFLTHPALERLEGGQKKTAELMLDATSRVVAQQAPPGSGKTFTLAAIVAALLSDPEARIVCLAPLNVAVVKICEELVQALRVAGVGEVPLALFSGTGKGKYREQLDRISENLLEAAATSEEFWEKLERSERMEVKRYVDQVKKRPRLAKEAKIADYVLNFEKRRVICCTLGFAEQIGTLIADRNVVVLDEAGQAPFTQLCATLSALPVIKKVLITGDRYQLAVNKQDIPEPLRQGFGLDTVLLNVDQAPAVDKTTLQTNYRSHRHIVECVEHMAYAPHGETLKPGPGDFRLLLDQMKLPVKDSPLLLINQSSPMEPEATSFSATNSGQTRTVMEFLEKLLGSFAGSVRVISLYAGQAAQIGKEIKARGMERAVISATADSMQGQEADVVIVATTVSRQQQWSDWQLGNAQFGDP